MQKTTEGFHHPEWAKYLLFLVLPRERRDEVLGDLEEGALRVAREFGPRRAHNYYVFQVITSVGWFILQRIEESKSVRWLIIMLVLAILAAFGVIPIARLIQFVASALK